MTKSTGQKYLPSLVGTVSDQGCLLVHNKAEHLCRGNVIREVESVPPWRAAALGKRGLWFPEAPGLSHCRCCLQT